jgi:ABC-2 type transport system permease protein
MMISNLIRLPLIFVSGVFLPLAALAPWGRWLAPFSPLSYSADLIRVGFGGAGYFAPSVDVGALLVFSGGFLALTRVIRLIRKSSG